MNNILIACCIFLLIFMSVCLTGCKIEKQEIKDSTGYIPVKVCVEEVSYTIVMKKGVLTINVSYLNLSSRKCTATINLGRNPKGLLNKGDSLTMYLHPDRPDELKYMSKDLRSGGKIDLKKYIK